MNLSGGEVRRQGREGRGNGLTAEKLAGLVFGIGHAIREQEQDVAGIQIERWIMVEGGIGLDTKRDSGGT